MSQYIGRRIVPVHGGVWDNSKNYEELTIVLHQTSGDSYISRRPVPAGTAIGDTNYWMLYSLYSAQIHEAEQHLTEATEDVKRRIEASEEKVTGELDATEKKVEQRTAAAEQVTNTNKSELNTRMDGIDKRLDANVAASTEKNADYAAEVVDARVDCNGLVFENLGAAMRRNDVFLRAEVKPSLGIAGISPAGERGNVSTASVSRVVVNGRCVAVDLSLNYVQDTEISGHWIRSSFYIPLSEFQEKYDGKKLVYQIYASLDCYIYLAWGYLASFKEGFTMMKMVHIQQGYNEVILDCASEEFKALNIPDDCTKFHLHYLFGNYREMTEQPPTGTHSFRFSVFARDDVGRALAGSDTAPQTAFAGYSKYSFYSENTERAVNAEHALVADLATQSQTANKAKVAETADFASNAGAVNAFQAMGFRRYADNAVIDTDAGTVIIPITSSSVLASDAGFSVYIGTVEELQGHDILVYKNEAFSYTQMALNAGNSWGGGTYTDVQQLFTSLDERYSVACFDDLLNAVIANGKTTADFTGKCYFMIYRNITWDLSQLEDGETVYNYYAIYKCPSDSVVYSRRELELQKTVSELSSLCSKLREECEMLDSERTAMLDSIDEMQRGNILWGKKWVACGDSFTEGDFSGYIDSNGLSGKNSPELYDSVKKMYKTYPWWVGERNNMTVINEAKCGSIMPLDKTYVEDPDNVAISTRNPFSLNRYKAIPEDVDYITLWFGINDSSHTNLGEITDVTNETFYGAWNVVLQYLIENHPYAKIGIIVTERGNVDYRNALREIAKKWGIPYLDMMGDLQVPVMMYRESELELSKTAGDLRYNAFKVGSSNGHPNLKAHEYQSTFIEAFLRRL